MIELLLIVFTILFAYKFLTMKVTWLRIGIAVSFFGLYVYAVNGGGAL